MPEGNILAIMILRHHQVKIVTSLGNSLKNNIRNHTVTFRAQQRIYLLIILQFISDGKRKRISKGIYNIDNTDYLSYKLVSAHHVTGDVMLQTSLCIDCYYVIFKDRHLLEQSGLKLPPFSMDRSAD